MTQNQQAAYEAGREAFHNEDSFNPYVDGSDLAEAWNKGYSFERAQWTPESRY